MGIEPTKKGFAIPRVSHSATEPLILFIGQNLSLVNHLRALNKIYFPSIFLEEEVEVWSGECEISEVTEDYQLSINCFYSGEEYTILSEQDVLLYQYASGEIDTVQCLHYVTKPTRNLSWRCE